MQKKEIKTGIGVNGKGVPSVCRAKKQNIKITRPPPHSLKPPFFGAQQAKQKVISNVNELV